MPAPEQYDRELAGQNAATATRVSGGAGELSSISRQIGQSSMHVARAMEEMARGASVQSQSAQNAMSQVNALSSTVQQLHRAAA